MKKTMILISLTISVFLGPVKSHALEISPHKAVLGIIQKGKTITENIEVRNNEKKQVILEKVRSSCECISIDYDKNSTIAKDASLILKITLDTTNLAAGKLKKFIFLSFANSEKAIHSIELTADIYSE